jgi:hypothetical protein
LCRYLETEELEQVLDAMFEVLVQGGQEVIKEGEDGDYFYVIESGEFEKSVPPSHYLYLPYLTTSLVLYLCRFNDSHEMFLENYNWPVFFEDDVNTSRLINFQVLNLHETFFV